MPPSTVAAVDWTLLVLLNAVGSTSRNAAPSSAPIAKLISALTQCARVANETSAARATDSSPPITLAAEMYARVINRSR